MQHLSSNSTLQGGKYVIESVLGQGGFGITYVAVQTGLNRKVAIKEFFMSEYCERDADTSHVSLGTSGSHELVERFKQKFIKEAQNIAALNHQHIIRIHDIFEENGTAYYVMEYDGNGSLRTLLNSCHTLTETEALRYVRQIADALRYIHNRQMNHLDVKPDNILLDDSNNTVLIDFGLSKRYDEAGHQTSTTPVGISHGYAPLEQYRAGGVSEFSPATDIYSLGATLYRMLIGKNPPDANEVNEDGLPTMPTSISSEICTAIEAAMQPRRKDRPQSIDAFLSLLGNSKNVVDEEKTVIELPHNPVVQTPEPDKTQILQEASQADNSNANAGEQEPPVSRENKISKSSYMKWLAPLAIVLAIACYFGFKGSTKQLPQPQPEPSDSVLVESAAASDIVNFTETVNGVSFNMIAVKGGTFTMGATAEQGSEARDSEKPAHRVTLSDYYIGETEVTQELWQAVMGSNPSEFKGEKRPVENVSWNDCQEFITKLNQLTGKTFRLPTEAEWEYAARGGSQSRGYKYAGSNNIEDVAWYEANSGDCTHPVGTKKANELGIFDMSGNVSEWCSDWFAMYPLSSVIELDPSGSADGTERVVRDAGWDFYDVSCRVSFRNSRTPNYIYPSFGFRIVYQSDENKIYDVVDQMPSFPGGAVSLMKYINENIHYPKEAKDEGIQGRVTVQLIIEKDGSITNVITNKSVDSTLDREAERVVNSMPKWIPGKQNGSAVRVRYFVPVVFRL